MRTLPSVLAGVFVLAASSAAFADEQVAGTYDVKFEEAGSTCDPPPVSFGRGKVTIEVKQRVLSINTDRIPMMYGTAQKNGKVKAQTPKLEAVGGFDQLLGRYSVGGRVDNGMLDLILTAEYVRGDNKKPYCNQSWHISGLRADAEKKKGK